jgi:hypothetical protein
VGAKKNNVGAKKVMWEQKNNVGAALAAILLK